MALEQAPAATGPAAGTATAGTRAGPSGPRPSAGRTWRSAAAAAGAAAVVGIAAAAATGALTASAEAPAPTPAASGEEAEVLAQLHAWLQSQGADVSKVQVKPSQAGPGAGLGLTATAAVSSARAGSGWLSWLWPRGRQGAANGAAAAAAAAPLVASFPLAAAITVRTCCEDPQLGQQFSWMLDKQLLDERSAIMVFLLLERLRGERSRYAPWIRALPTSFDVPIVFSDADLAELRGTTLQRATAAVGGRMREQWARLEEPLAQVARDLGLRRPTWEDWAWAYCVFWSRGQSLPVPESGSASSALAQHSSNGHGKVNIQMLEGLVPGLDFANHRAAPGPQCWWEVVAPERGAAGASTSGTPPAAPAVRLQLHGGGAVRPGEELFISYGDKSNEELLMLYGFALPRNPHDHLMLYCPLPPQSEWDDVMHARMELLQAYALRPQFFLPHPDQVPGARPAAAKPSKAKAGSAPPPAAPDAPVPPLVLPAEVLDALEVFVLNFQELAVRSKALQAKMEERRAARTAGAPLAAMSQHSPVLELAPLRSRLDRLSPPELKHYLAALGLRMATLTTFIRLLEIKVAELEGPDGTGPLEADEALLAGMDGGGEQQGGQGAAAGTPAVSTGPAAQRQRRLRAAVLYRLGQKGLARAWLVRAKAELAGLLALMRDMQARVDGLERSGATAAAGAVAGAAAAAGGR